MKKALKIIGITLLIIITIAIIAAIVVVIYAKGMLNKINYENVTREQITINEGVEENLEKYRNIAILGLDTRDNTFANSRSDCIMIISINNKTKEVKIVSVYRDTYLQIEGYGLDKVNHAYAYKKAPLSISTLNTNLDLDITEYVTINFESVISVVDAMGGVNITVSNAEATQIPGLSTGGTYNLTGTQALAYGRIRKIDNDYVRTERMRTVLEKVFEKAQKLDIVTLNNLVNELLPKVSTNIKQNEIIKLIPQIYNYKVTASVGWPYEVRGITLQAWYGVPVTLEENVKKLHEELFEDEEYEVSQTVKDISDKIIKKTGYR